MQNGLFNAESQCEAVERDVRGKLQAVQRRIADKHKITQENFARELSRKLVTQEVSEDADILLWHSLFSYMLDFPDEQESNPDPPLERATDGAADGGPFFWLNSCG